MLNNKIQGKIKEHCKYNPPQIGEERESFWIEVMKENENFYRELELEEKRELRKLKLEKINKYIQ